MGLKESFKGLFKYATIMVYPTDEETAHLHDRCAAVPYRGYGEALAERRERAERRTKK